LQIKEEALYRSDYDTFDDYCRERWGFKRSHAYQLIADAKTVAGVQNSGQILTQVQATELGRVPKKDRNRVLDWATEKADGKAVGVSGSLVDRGTV
jgi:hypothetical protein